MTRSLTSFLVVALLGTGASAQPLIFDDLPRDEHVGEGYAALGVDFSLTDFGVVSGISEGDPGNWGLEGTNGSAFMGFNGFPSYEMEIRFHHEVEGFSMDASRSGGSNAGDGLEVEFWKGDLEVDSTAIVFDEINIWTTVGTKGVIDRVTFRSTGFDFHPYGVDNINYTPTGDCYADFNGDGVLDLFDFLGFVNEFNAGSDAADCDGDGDLSLFDFLCFVNAFNAGC